MAFSGYPLRTDLTNSTPARDTHASVHNASNAAINDLQDQVTAGGGGGGGEGLIIPVTTPALTWNLVHALPFRPTVQITDSSGNVVYPDNVRHIDATHIQVTFSATFSGEASLT